MCEHIGYASVVDNDDHTVVVTVVVARWTNIERSLAAAAVCTLCGCVYVWLI